MARSQNWHDLRSEASKIWDTLVVDIAGFAATCEFQVNLSSTVAWTALKIGQNAKGTLPCFRLLQPGFSGCAIMKQAARGHVTYVTSYASGRDLLSESCWLHVLQPIVTFCVSHSAQVRSAKQNRPCDQNAWEIGLEPQQQLCSYQCQMLRVISEQ